jgi:hypothetical protein
MENGKAIVTLENLNFNGKLRTFSHSSPKKQQPINLFTPQSYQKTQADDV